MKIVGNFRKFHLPLLESLQCRTPMWIWNLGLFGLHQQLHQIFNVLGAKSLDLLISCCLQVSKCTGVSETWKLGCVGRKTENQVKSIQFDRSAFTRSSSVCLAPYSLVSKPNEGGIKKNIHFINILWISVFNSFSFVLGSSRLNTTIIISWLINYYPHPHFIIFFLYVFSIFFFCFG